MEYIKKQVAIQPNLNEITYYDTEGNIRYHAYEVRYAKNYYKISKKFIDLKKAKAFNQECYIKCCIIYYENNYK